MEQSSRDKILAMLLPAILIGCGYFLLFNKQKDLDAACAAYDAAVMSAVDPMLVNVERMKLAELNEKAGELKEATAQLTRRREELASLGKAAPIMRTQALRRLSAMLWDRGLFPYEESAVSDNSAKLSPSFDGILKKLATPPATAANPTPAPLPASGIGGGDQHRVWRVRFYGRYADVMKMLEELRDSKSPVIPISLDMSEMRTETQWRSWTLLLWI